VEPRFGRQLTIEKGVNDELAIPLHEVVDVAENSTVTSEPQMSETKKRRALTYHMMGDKNEGKQWERVLRLMKD